MFVPDQTGKTFSIRVHKYVAHGIITFFVLLITAVSILTYKAGDVAAQLQVIYSLKAEKEDLQKENAQLKDNLKRLDKIERIAAYLEDLAIPSQLMQDVLQSGKSEKPDSNVNVIKTAMTETYDNSSPIPNIIPVNGWITMHYKDSVSGKISHPGVDFAAEKGAPIKVTAPGIVEKVQNDKIYGLQVVVNHGQGIKTMYGHCSQILVASGDSVKRGQTIALVGNTGLSTAPHLHYEVIKDNIKVDPMMYLPSKKK